MQITDFKLSPENQRKMSNKTWEIRASGFVTANSTTFDFGWVDAMKLTHYCWIYGHSQ